MSRFSKKSVIPTPRADEDVVRISRYEGGRRGSFPINSPSQNTDTRRRGSLPIPQLTAPNGQKSTKANKKKTKKNIHNVQIQLGNLAIREIIPVSFADNHDSEDDQDFLEQDDFSSKRGVITNRSSLRRGSFPFEKSNNSQNSTVNPSTTSVDTRRRGSLPRYNNCLLGQNESVSSKGGEGSQKGFSRKMEQVR